MSKTHLQVCLCDKWRGGSPYFEPNYPRWTYSGFVPLDTTFAGEGGTCVLCCWYGSILCANCMHQRSVSVLQITGVNQSCVSMLPFDVMNHWYASSLWFDAMNQWYESMMRIDAVNRCCDSILCFDVASPPCGARPLRDRASHKNPRVRRQVFPTLGPRPRDWAKGLMIHAQLFCLIREAGACSAPMLFASTCILDA